MFDSPTKTNIQGGELNPESGRVGLKTCAGISALLVTSWLSYSAFSTREKVSDVRPPARPVPSRLSPQSIPSIVREPMQIFYSSMSVVLVGKSGVIKDTPVVLQSAVGNLFSLKSGSAGELIVPQLESGSYTLYVPDTSPGYFCLSSTKLTLAPGMNDLGSLEIKQDTPAKKLRLVLVGQHISGTREQQKFAPLPPLDRTQTVALKMALESVQAELEFPELFPNQLFTVPLSTSQLGVATPLPFQALAETSLALHLPNTTWRLRRTDAQSFECIAVIDWSAWPLATDFNSKTFDNPSTEKLVPLPVKLSPPIVRSVMIQNKITKSGISGSAELQFEYRKRYEDHLGQTNEGWRPFLRSFELDLDVHLPESSGIIGPSIDIQEDMTAIALDDVTNGSVELRLIMQVGDSDFETPKKYVVLVSNPRVDHDRMAVCCVLTDNDVSTNE